MPPLFSAADGHAFRRHFFRIIAITLIAYYAMPLSLLRHY
jgi:hypothetical protein